MVVQVSLKEGSQIEDLGTFSKGSLFFGSDFFCLQCQPVVIDFQQDFDCVPDWADGAVVPAFLVVWLSVTVP